MTPPDAAAPRPANLVPALVPLLRRALRNNQVLSYLGAAPTLMLIFVTLVAKVHIPSPWDFVWSLIAWFLFALVLYVLALRWVRMLPPTPTWARILSLAGVSLVAALCAAMPLGFTVEPLASQPAFAAGIMAILAAGAVLAVVGVCVRAYPVVRQAIRDGWDPPLPPETH